MYGFQRLIIWWINEEVMRVESLWIIIGLSIGIVIGMAVAVAVAAFLCLRYHRKHSKLGNSSSRKAATVPIRVNGVNSCAILSDSSAGTELPRSRTKNLAQSKMPCLRRLQKTSSFSASGILQYSHNSDAVKVLATDSRQGEKEFQTEVMLLGRLHHRNLMNLVGYCAEKSQHMVVYVYMSGGSLASHLYIPPVIHGDIKSSNVLLDQSMRARLADSELSSEATISKHRSNIEGTFGYLDPEYISTRSFTKKNDVYSYGVLLFELIAARDPVEGLLKHTNLAAMNDEGDARWEEIFDPRLNGNFDVDEVNEVAAVAHKCVNPVARQRPFIRDVVHVLSRRIKPRENRQPLSGSSTPGADEVVVVSIEQLA